MKKQVKQIVKAPVETASFKKLTNRLGLFIGVFAFCLYVQSISFNYAYDDVDVIQGNRLVAKGIKGIPEILSTDRLFGASNNIDYRLPEYRPAPLIVFALAWQIFGNNPHIYHFINVLLYAITCWLLFLLLCKLFEKQNIALPFVCALLYAAHPIHTEVVDNIKSLDEILCFLFALLSAFLFIRFVETKSVLNFVMAIVCYLLALMSKETGVTFLIIIPLLIFVFTNAKLRNVLIISSALLVLSALFFLLRSVILIQVPASKFNLTFLNSIYGAPDFVGREATALYILLKYIGLLIFPHPLSYDYSFAQIPVQEPGNPAVIFSAMIYSAMLVYGFSGFWRKDAIAFFILFYLFALAPVSNVFFLLHATMAERFLYIPSLGFCVLLSFALLRLTKTEIAKNTINNPGQFVSANTTVLVVALILAGLYSIKTITRNPDWKDNATLFRHDLEIVPNSAKAHVNYGITILYSLYPDEKNGEKKSKLLDSAITEFKMALSIYNDLPAINNDLANAYFHKNDLPNAIRNYEIAIRSYTAPAAESFNNLGFAYSSTGQFEKALNMLDSALKYKPDYALAYINKAGVFIKQGKDRDAIAECDKALKYSAANEGALVAKGFAYSNLFQNDSAIQYLDMALAINPTDVNCLKVLGMAYQNKGDTIRANQYFEKADKIWGQH